MTINRIDPTPARISTNLSIERQTPKRDFGDRVKVGLDQTTGAIANGASVVGGFIPGGAIVSAAVSSVSGMTNGSTPGGGGSAVTAQYGATGVVNLGGTSGGSGGLSTTLGGGTTGGSVGGLGIGTTTGGGTANYATGGSSGSSIGEMNSSLVSSQKENAEMMRLQMAMQRENLVFSSVSNVLKTRHDTAKNSISNVR